MDDATLTTIVGWIIAISMIIEAYMVVVICMWVYDMLKKKR